MIEQTRSQETYEVLREAKRALDEESKLLAKVYNEPSIFEMEAKKIFQKTWVFLAHETEIPWPGDYVLRRIIDDSFIVARDEDGQIHVLFNMCRHRGMQLCRADAGNTSHFRCPYHGYTYKNTGKLNGVPFQKEAYGPEGLDKDEWAMTPAPRVGVYEGMIFASLDPDVRPLEEHIGDMGWYLDFYLKKSRAGMEVVGPPQRWVMHADWKLASENFIGDGYHTQSTHMSTIKAGIMRVKSPAYLKDGVQILAGSHGCLFMGFKPGSLLQLPPEYRGLHEGEPERGSGRPHRGEFGAPLERDDFPEHEPAPLLDVHRARQQVGPLRHAARLAADGSRQDGGVVVVPRGEGRTRGIQESLQPLVPLDLRGVGHPGTGRRGELERHDPRRRRGDVGLALPQLLGRGWTGRPHPRG